MPYLDLELAGSRCRALRDFIILSPGGRDDLSARQRVQELLSALNEAVEDDECERLIREIAGHAAELFSAQGHRSWRTGVTSGADVLRLQILRTLDTYHARLSAIAAGRAKADEEGDTGLNRA